MLSPTVLNIQPLKMQPADVPVQLGFSHKLLRDHPVMIYLPFNVGNFFFRETYANNVPLLVPSADFL